MVTPERIHGVWKPAQAAEYAGISYSTMYRLEKAGHFPKKRRTSPYTVGYIASEIIEYVGNLETVEETRAAAN